MTTEGFSDEDDGLLMVALPAPLTRLGSAPLLDTVSSRAAAAAARLAPVRVLPMLFELMLAEIDGTMALIMQKKSHKHTTTCPLSFFISASCRRDEKE